MFYFKIAVGYFIYQQNRSIVR